MHTTWRAPVAWLLCFSARFVVLDTLLSSSLTPTIASLLDLCLFIPSPTRSFPRIYIYTYLFYLFLSLSFSFSTVLNLSLSCHSKYSGLPSRLRYLFFPYASLSLSLLEVLQPRYLFSSRPPERCPLGGKERAEKYALFACLSIVLSLFPATTSLDESYPESFSRGDEDSPFSPSVFRPVARPPLARSQPVPSKRGGSGSKRIPLLPSPSRSRHDPTESAALVSGLTIPDTSLFNRSIDPISFRNFSSFFFFPESNLWKSVVIIINLKDFARFFSLFFFFFAREIIKN